MLDELLAVRPDLRQAAEAYAARIMSGVDRSAVADDVENALPEPGRGPVIRQQVVAGVGFEPT